MSRPRRRTSKTPAPAQPAAQTGSSVSSPALAELSAAPLWLYAIVGAVVFLTFLPTITFDFLNWDDNVNVTGNPLLQAFSIGRLWRIWSAPYESLYVPLVYTTYLMDRVVGGGQAWSFHLSNVVIHASAAVLLLRLAVMLGLRPLPALLAALFFGLHPLQAEPVSWVTGRKDTLSGALVIATVVLWIAGRRSSRPWLLHCAVAAHVLALLSKPSASVVPLVILSYEAFHGGLRDRAWWQHGAMLFVASVLAVGITSYGQPSMDLASAQWSMRLPVVLAAYAHYGTVAVWPVGLVPIALLRIDSPLFLRATAGALLLLSVVAVAYGLRRRIPTVSWLLSSAIVVVLPNSGLVPFHYQFMSLVADRYAYVALAFGALAAASLLAPSLSHATPRKWTLAGVGAALIACVTVAQSMHWRNSETLWMRQIQQEPRNSDARYNLANFYAVSGRNDQAITALEKLLADDPTYARAYANLIVSLRGLGPTAAPKLRATAEQALQHLKSGSIDTNLVRGVAFMELLQFPEAERELSAALSHHPEEYELLQSLGVCYMNMRRFAEAEGVFRKALVLQPGHGPAFSNLGWSFLAQRKKADAMEALGWALRLQPNNAKAAQWMKQAEALP